MDKQPPAYGNKVICKRLGAIAVSFQITNIDNGQMGFKKELNVDFGEMEKGQPSFSNKKTVRLNCGEIALLISFVLGYQQKSGAGHRESGLWLSFQAQNTDKGTEMYINMHKHKEQLHFVKLTHAERFQIYRLCLECLTRDGQSSADALAEIKTFFAPL
jgi:hypothetical protein